MRLWICEEVQDGVIELFGERWQILSGFSGCGGSGGYGGSERMEGLQSCLGDGRLAEQLVQQCGGIWILLLEQQSGGGVAVPGIGVFEQSDEFGGGGL